MTSRTATKTGNWSDVTVWDGGASLPGSGDTADSNGYTVTIDQDIDLSPGGELINTHGSAGGFTCSTARSITANVTATGRTVLTVSHNAGTVVTITGNLLGGTTSSTSYAVALTGSGQTNIAGDITGRGGIALHGGYSNPLINITGKVTGGSSAADAYGLRLFSGTTIITGDVYGGSFTNCHGINSGAANLTINGNCYGNATFSGVHVSSGALIVNGNCYQSSTSSGSGVTAASTGAATITINGNCYGNGVTSPFGGGLYLQNNAHVAVVNGNAVGGTGGGYGINNSGAGTVSCNAAIAGNACAGLYGQSSTGSTRCKTMQAHANGMIPVYGFVKLIPNQAANYAEFIRSDTGAAIQLSNDYPAVGDVRSGTVYKLTTLTGTMTGGAVSISPAGRM